MNETMNSGDQQEYCPDPNLKRHSTSSRLMRGLSKNIKRLSAPVRAANRFSFHSNESTILEGNTSIHSGRLSLKSVIAKSRVDSFLPSQENSSTDVEPPTAKLQHIRSIAISGPIVPYEKYSEILENYADTQLLDAGSVQTSGGENHDDNGSTSWPTLSSRSGRPTSTTNTTNSSTPLTPFAIVNEHEPHDFPPLDLSAAGPTRSSTEYICPRSQWTMTVASLIAKEEQASTAEQISRTFVDHVKHSTPTAQYITTRCEYPAPLNTTTDYSEFCNLRPDFTEEAKTELLVGAQFYSGLLFEESEDILKPASFWFRSQGQVQPLRSSRQSETSSVYSNDEYMAEMYPEAIESKAQEAHEALHKETTRTHNASLADPLLHQALQTSVDDDENSYKALKGHIWNKLLSSTSSTWRDKPFIPNWAKSRNRKKLYGRTAPEGESAPDPTLLNVLSSTQDNSASGKEVQRQRQSLVSRILGKSPDLWKNVAADVDSRIEKSGRERSSDGWLGD